MQGRIACEEQRLVDSYRWPVNRMKTPKKPCPARTSLQKGSRSLLTRLDHPVHRQHRTRTAQSVGWRRIRDENIGFATEGEALGVLRSIIRGSISFSAAFMTQCRCFCRIFVTLHHLRTQLICVQYWVVMRCNMLIHKSPPRVCLIRSMSVSSSL